MRRIHLISGPRNISTALMYAFGHRSDCTVVDEPLYAHYLSLTGKNHPGRQAVLKEMSSDHNEVVQNVFLGDHPTPVLFIKNMAHHIMDMPLDFMDNMSQVFLIRDPKRLIVSFDKVYPNPSIDDIGLKREWELYQHLVARGHNPIVLDSGEVLKSPRTILTQLCDLLNIPFLETMLQWPAGPRKEDGSWAPYWYSNVHKSTGFQTNITQEVVMRDALISVYEESLLYYNPLFAKALKVNEH